MTIVAAIHPATTLADRAAGAVLGALIGDALGLGPHWYYDLDGEPKTLFVSGEVPDME